MAFKVRALLLAANCHTVNSLVGSGAKQHLPNINCTYLRRPHTTPINISGLTEGSLIDDLLERRPAFTAVFFFCSLMGGCMHGCSFSVHLAIKLRNLNVALKGIREKNTDTVL